MGGRETTLAWLDASSCGRTPQHVVERNSEGRARWLLPRENGDASSEVGRESQGAR